MLARFSEMFYQYQIKSPEVAFIKFHHEYIETKMRNYSDSDRKERRRCNPLTLIDIINIINRHQRCYYSKMLFSD